jgi:hypothetical protein
MLTSAVGGAASAAGIQFRSVPDVLQAVESAKTFDGVLLLIDLAARGFVVSDLQHHFSEQLLTQAVAYGPHVHEQLLQDARDAGIGTVLSRGQFNTRFPQLIRQFVSS